MERPLGAFEHSFWLYDQIHPLHFALRAKINGIVDSERLCQALVQVQRQHPLLRTRIAVDSLGRPQFVEQAATIPLRTVWSVEEQQGERELEAELSQSFDWTIAPLVRVVLIQAAQHSEIIVTCHHAIADGLAVANLIRDLVQGLETDSGIAHSLTHARPIEQLLPQAIAPLLDTNEHSTPSVVQTVVSPPYPVDISTRPRPHIRTALLSTAFTQQLSDRCREAQTTVHGAICAAFLLAISRQRGTVPSPLKCLSPVNVRSLLKQPLAETVGMYISFALTHHTVSDETTPWELARSLKARLSEMTQPQNLFKDFLPRQMAMATLPEAQAVAQGLQQQYGYDLMVTNLGHLRFDQTTAVRQIEALYGPAVMTGVEQGQVVGVATINDRLSLTLASHASTTSATEATTLLTNGLQLLSALASAQQTAAIYS